MKIALVSWGLTRSLKKTLPSLKKNLFDVLKENQIDYDIYLHTYKIIGNYSNTRTGEKNMKLDDKEFQLLNPFKFKVDIQNNIKIDFKNYFSKKDPYNNKYESCKYVILGLYSKLQATNLIKESGIKYDYIIFYRTDVEYLNKFDINWLKHINNNNIIVPSFICCRHNFNDRFAICNYENGINFGSFFKVLKIYSKKYELNSELIQRKILDDLKINVYFVNFFFNRVRSNGFIKND